MSLACLGQTVLWEGGLASNSSLLLGREFSYVCYPLCDSDVDFDTGSFQVQSRSQFLRASYTPKNDSAGYILDDVHDLFFNGGEWQTAKQAWKRKHSSQIPQSSEKELVYASWLWG